MRAVLAVLLAVAVVGCSSEAGSRSQIPVPSQRFVAWTVTDGIDIASEADTHPEHVVLPNFDARTLNVLSWSEDGNYVLVDSLYDTSAKSELVDRRAGTASAIEPGSDYQFLGDTIFRVDYPSSVVERTVSGSDFRHLSAHVDLEALRGYMNPSYGVGPAGYWSLSAKGFVRVPLSGVARVTKAPAFVLPDGRYPSSLSPDGRMLAVIDNGVGSKSTTPVVWLDDLRTGKVSQVPLPPGPNGDPWTSAVPTFDQSGQLLVSFGAMFPRVDMYRLDGKSFTFVSHGERATPDGEVREELGDSTVALYVDGVVEANDETVGGTRLFVAISGQTSSEDV